MSGIASSTGFTSAEHEFFAAFATLTVTEPESTTTATHSSGQTVATTESTASNTAQKTNERSIDDITKSVEAILKSQSRAAVTSTASSNESGKINDRQIRIITEVLMDYTVSSLGSFNVLKSSLIVQLIGDYAEVPRTEKERQDHAREMFELDKSMGLWDSDSEDM